MDVVSVIKGIFGVVLFVVGLLFVYAFVAVLPTTECTDVFLNGELIRSSCRAIYYNIGSYRVSGGTIGWILLACGVILLVIAFWIVREVIESRNKNP